MSLTAAVTCTNPDCDWTGLWEDLPRPDGVPDEPFSGVFDARFCPDCGSQVGFEREALR